MTSNFATSLIRTYVPIIVGALVSYLVTLGIELDVDAQTGLVVFLTALLQGVYYLISRILERRYPNLSFLLGSGSQPKYVEPSTIK